jgi:WD40 repeat protein
VALSPGGTTLATASGESVQLWDVATGHQIGSLTVPYYGADSLEFSPDGKTLSTGSDGGTVQVWDVAYLTDPVSDLCALGGRSLTRAEWALYAPGLAYRNICP